MTSANTSSVAREVLSASWACILFTEVTRSYSMKNLSGFLSILAVVSILSTDVTTVAQTREHISSDLSRRTLRKQDRSECTVRATQQNIAKRNQAEFVRKCMADRQAARKAEAGSPSMGTRVKKWTRAPIAAAKKRWAEDKEKFDECQRRLAETLQTQRLSLHKRIDFLERCMVGL